MDRSFPSAVLVWAVTVLLAGPASAAAQNPGGAGGTPSTDGAAPSAPTSSPPRRPAASADAPPAVGRTTRARVNLRTRPGDGRVVARLPRATRLAVGCQRIGPLAPGRLGASRVWDRVSRPRAVGGWVADGYLDTGTDGLVAPLCNAAALSAPPSPGAGSGSCAIGSPVAVLAPFASPRALIAAALPGAKASRAAYRIPVAVTLAQTILETGGGRFTAGANNFFGLKAQATRAPGRYAFGSRAAGCVLKKTREAERGRLVITIGAFRAYDNLADSILDHGERLTVNPVYRAAFAHTQRPRRFAAIIARSYATDPRYAAKLLALMDRYELEELG